MCICKQPSTIIIINVQGKCFKGLEKMVQTGEGRVKENFKAIKRKRPSWNLNLEKKGISHNYCKDMISFFPSLNCAGE